MVKTKSVMIIAGEASGDLHGANLAKELTQLAPDIKMRGLGGKKMQLANVELLADISDLAVCGLFEIFRYLPKFVGLFNHIKKALQTERPDLLILIDYPTFNLKLAQVAHKLNIPMLYYISPQIWAWHTSRIKKIKRYIDMMAVILPFEVDFYQKYAMPAKYVGHPLLKEMSPFIDLPGTEVHNNPKTTIGLLPGSRKNEIKYILPTLLETARLLHKKMPQAEFILPLANTVSKEEIQQHLEKMNLPIRLIEENHYTAMKNCHAVIVASGTAVLELALLGVPMAIVYKGNPLSSILAKWLIKIPYIGICNVIAGKKIVEEFLQNEAQPSKILHEISRLLEDTEYRKKQKQELLAVVDKLRLEKECNIATLAFDVLQRT